MIAACPNCKTRLNIADEKVTPEGIRIKCPKCATVFAVKKPEAGLPAAPGATPAPKPATPVAAAPRPVTAPPAAPKPAAGPAPAPRPASPPPSAPKPAAPAAAPKPAPAPPPVEAPKPAAPPAATPAAPKADVGLSDEEKKAHEKARRLARVLVSDMVLYNKDAVEDGLKNNTIAKTMGDEIKKSWQLFKQQVGADIANNTTYFKDALNDIMGKGRKIF